jgi:hypothetical protein
MAEGSTGPATPDSPLFAHVRKPKRTRWHRFLDFIEHPIVLSVLGIVGGLVAAIYPPVLFVSVGCLLLALHRSKAVADLSRKVQAFWYAVVFIVGALGMFFIVRSISSRAHKFANEIATAVWSMQSERAKPAPAAATGAPVTTAQSIRPDTPMRKRAATQASDSRIIFTTSPLWTNERKETVRNQIHLFDQYLLKVGITPPPVVSSIEITETRQVAWAIATPANPPFDQRHIPMSTKSWTPFWIRKRYAEFVFDMALGVNGLPPFGNPRISWIASEYFTASSLNIAPDLNPARINGWVVALWDLRTARGQEFTDRALMYALKAPIAPGKNDDKDHLNETFRDRLAQGVSVVSNNFDEIVEVNKILERHGLLH